ncbi:MAG: Na+/H+ antiporter NhaC [Myxococcales bacterium]|nr:Na+/H+ antiporter NhaC [Myxococcales bacterium]MDH5565474.1 Na+/H+ antiporter NhaC [Myxococcales bacterium]
MTTTSTKPVALWQALLPVAALILFLFVQISIFGGPPHLPLILGSVVAAATGLILGHPWREIEEGMVEGIVIAMKAILILMVVGILIGTWIVSGIVPVLIDYGLRLLSPSYFLAAACVICSVVSVATGSSWTTAGTVGVALIGIGHGLGVPPPMTAGAIVSGAYFGDKISPLSDSTNLSPAVAGAELFDHVQYMLITAIPAWILSLALYGMLGLSVQNAAIDTTQVDAIRSTLAASFHLSPLLLLPPLLVIAAVAFRIPALPALIGGALLGGVMALWIQGTSLQQVAVAAHDGYTAHTGSAQVDELLSRGGLNSMMETVALVLCALTFGGIMERTGLLRRLADSILKLAHSTGSLVLATVGSCITTNIVAPDQYMSIIVPGRMYRETYAARGLAPTNLSRALEAGGTLSSPLVPWNTCGAFMSTALMVSAGAYFPYAFLNLITPVLVVLVSFAGFRIAMLPAASDAAPTETRVAARAEPSLPS